MKKIYKGCLIMGILTGLLFAGIMGKWISYRNKEKMLKPEEITKLHHTHKIAVIGCLKCDHKK